MFIVNLPMVNIYKFCKIKILSQPPEEPREQQLGEVRKCSSYQNVRATQNFIKDEMIGRVNIL